jgi:hypothetical protein
VCFASGVGYAQPTPRRGHALVARRQEAETFTLAKYSSVANLEIVHYSDHVLSPIERLLLGLGLKVIPTPLCSAPLLRQSITRSILSLQCRLSLALYFNRPLTALIKFPIILIKDTGHPPLDAGLLHSHYTLSLSIHTP